MTGILSSVTVKLDNPPDPFSLIPASGGLAWLTEALTLVGQGPFLYIDPGTGSARFQRGAAAVAGLLDGAAVVDEVDAPGSGPVVFGSWTFDERTPGSRLVIPSTVYGYGDGVAWKTTVDFREASAPGGVTEVQSPADPGLDEAGWKAAVATAVEQIRSGRLEKVVLARKVEVEAGESFDQNVLARRLAETFPGCFTFCFEDLVGASPELLVRRLGELVDSVPLAGSTRRGATEAEDLRLGRELKESEKNLEEHALAVATVMDKLSVWCSSLLKESEPSLLLLANLQHLSTKVQGRLKGSPSSLVLAGALHPTAAVCGVPQEQALDLIRELERFDRGRYAGPVGWMDRHGDGEWAIALRCAQISGSRADIFAGAGVVAGSDPESELEETRLKLEAMLSALAPALLSP
ncbi:MAG TPA: isochorismate synthase [Actinomycetota bacterium]|nr:isochorismate synthase [Actinomycetota bacterium]